VYGQLQQADRSGLVSVKFDEIELLDGAREKIDAIGTGSIWDRSKETSMERTLARIFWYGLLRE